jgi:hypothetical protein
MSPKVRRLLPLAVLCALGASLLFAASASAATYTKFGTAVSVNPGPPVADTFAHRRVLQVTVAAYDPNTFPAGQTGGVTGTLPFGGQPLSRLDGRASVQYYFVGPVTCGNGVPRLQVAIDTDGDGVSNGNAFAYVGTAPSFTGCASDTWVTQNFDDGATRWDWTQLGSSAFVTSLDDMIAGLPGAKMLRGSIVFDPTWAGFTPGVGAGTAYFDNFILGSGFAFFG